MSGTFREVGPKMASVCLVLGLVSSILGLTAVVVALASSQWLRVRTPILNTDLGLMRHCDVISLYCGDMEHLNYLIESQYAGWFRSVQSMYILHCLGMLVSAAAYILYIVKFLEFKGNFRFLTVFTFLTLASGIYSVAIFGTNAKKFVGVTDSSVYDDVATLGYGYYVAILGCCLSFVVMLLSAMEAVHAVDLIQNMQNRFNVWTTPYTLFVDQEA